ncbi:hypothetical protein [Magnetococcus sp. PR-3]|uniref:hypothetical protein n=1 Tax=Magnetococcus sp. PR-3 TaxID=3120355 RepID=UPI002FCE0ACE
MAYSPAGPVLAKLEYIISRPPLATLVVGSSILILLALIQWLSSYFPWCAQAKFVVPFIPPFFITRTAKAINIRKAEHNFIRDAVPYVFVAYPAAMTQKALQEVKPAMVSDSAAYHLETSLEQILQEHPLSAHYFMNPQQAEEVLEHLMVGAQSGQCRISGFQVTLKGADGQPKRYLLNSMLKRQGKGFKWQATLMLYHAWDASKQPE